MLPENQQAGDASAHNSHAVKDQQAGDAFHDNSQTGGDQQIVDPALDKRPTSHDLRADDGDQKDGQEVKDEQVDDSDSGRCHQAPCSCIFCWSAGKPDGPLDTKLADARERTPRFLFRGWDDISNDISGGHQNLKTPDAVTPLAYSNPAESEVTSIFDQSETALRNMVLNHLTVYKPDPGKPPTQFSSWASTITGAFRFAEDSETPYISVIDTVMLAGSNYVAHVPALDFLDPDCREYHWEYLVHGVVKGCYYAALPMTYFTRIDFPDKPAWGALPFTPGLTDSPDFPDSSNAESKQMLDNALKVAKIFGSHFSLAMFLAITCQKLKHPKYCNNRARTRKKIQKLVFLADSHKLRVPFEWCAERSIMVDGVVDTWAYEEVQAMLLCMRLLVMQRYPREVKKRWPGLKREEVLRDGMLMAETKRDEVCEGGSLPSLADYSACCSTLFLAVAASSDKASGEANRLSWQSLTQTLTSIQPGYSSRTTDTASIAPEASILKSRLRSPPLDNESLATCSAHGTIRLLIQAVIRTSTPHQQLPLAYHLFPSKARRNFFDFDRTSLRAMVNIHVKELDFMATEFSSWGASLQTALSFAKTPNAHISIIDTRKLNSDNMIFHVPTVTFLLLHLKDNLDCEYLAHGIVGGRAHAAVPMSVLVEHSVPRLGGHRGFFCPGTYPQRITAKEVEQACAVGYAYGGAFVVPVTIAVLCQTLRHGNHWRNAKTIEGLDLVNDALKDCVVPEDWIEDPSIMTDIVHTVGFGDVEQMINLIRSLAKLRAEKRGKKL